MQGKFFRIGDIFIYAFLVLIFSVLILRVNKFSSTKASKVEIYVDNNLKYVYPLQKEEKNVFVDTVLGGINVEFKDNMVRVTSSNSPRKIIMKQGYIESPGDLLIGIPDKVVIKIVGDNEDDLDFVAK